MSELLLLEPSQVLAEIAVMLDARQIQYFLAGSFASGMRGEFRATNDVDLVCRFSSAAVPGFLEAARTAFYCDELSIPRAVQEEASFNIIHKQTFVKVDFFTKLGALEVDQFARATKCLIPGTNSCICVSTTEYNIIAKLRWYEMSNRQLERQLGDVRAMVEINRDSLDREYLSHWAPVVGVAKLLEELL